MYHSNTLKLDNNLILTIENLIMKQVAWHPGFRYHQLIGRNLAFFILKALKEALTKWKNSGEYDFQMDPPFPLLQLTLYILR
jgi:hypothetical protein